MGLLGKFLGNGSSGNQSSSNGSTSNFSEAFNGNQSQSLNGHQYNWGNMMKGDFSGIKMITPEEVEHAEEQSKELKQQTQLWGRKNQADTQSLESAKRIHNNEQVHTRDRVDKVLSARDQDVKTKEHLAANVNPKLHEQNERLGLAQEKGQKKIEMINQEFSKRREALSQMRSNWGK